MTSDFHNRILAMHMRFPYIDKADGEILSNVNKPPFSALRRKVGRHHFDVFADIHYSDAEGLADIDYPYIACQADFLRLMRL